MFDRLLFERAPLDVPCPERKEFRSDEWLDQYGSLLVGRLARRWLTRRDCRRQFLLAVDSHAEEIAACGDQEIRQRARATGLRMRREGLHDIGLAEAFALIRETSFRRLGMRHFDEQLLGGWLMAKGMIAEMATGEGKTLTAVLPAAAAALSGMPVHVVTVNDYLASRDCEAMRPVYEALGLSVGTVVEGMDHAQRQEIYRRDIAYCTNKTLAFDYLRDRICLGGDTDGLHLLLENLYGGASLTHKLLLRGLHFAIVDEADSVLIDEARTPLIISGSAPDGSAAWVRTALDLARDLRLGNDFIIMRREGRVSLTEGGYGRLADLCSRRTGLWRHVRWREEVILQALAALNLYHRDEHYLVRDGTVQIIDVGTGRVMPDRTWGQGLHQLIEAKEGCETLSDERRTLGSISYQRFFSRYLRLAGMTGTAKEVAGELGRVYGLAVAAVPTHRRSRRRVFSTRIYSTATEKWRQIALRVTELHAQNIPVLLGTRTVAASERAAAELATCGLVFNLLSAKQDSEESEVVASAGQAGAITIATNMAGRGTDIKLGEGVDALGGLHVILSECHEAARIDRQLAGRSARQGDAGCVEAFLSLEDTLLEPMRGGLAERLMLRLAGNGRWRALLLSGWMRFAQLRAERQQAQVRTAVLKSDRQLGDMLSFSGQRE
ncbi:preprotein translocase subunit SecA [Quatrionicoccus australiensis]|uniref:preprotein translocase subunit SecA n=1 Tax=Quatrionicoccus australiensis TaxID=138118 RepID=UPI001CF83DA0|nr:preprotein translocase subunit SecA [Quatrionicoccus australiensis]UCV14045.1 preprotein translocase subunit SecA [Quatrionicoccus australiensis]